MLRVYALYSKSQEIASFLAFTLLMRFISGVWVLTQLFDISIGSLNFNYICIAPQQLHKEPKIAIFVFGEMAIQGILCCLTLLKTWSLGSLEWPHAQNLASVLNRDALSVFVVLSGTFAAIIVSTYKSGLGVLFVFPALTSVTSCAGCRLILHLHRLGERETSAGPEDTMFTSIDATGTWDTQTHHVRT
ncbi:hypothetical protein L218DRAFT_400455 [Marasmius fiardii PR-910]|nr:hypothetical protein L218DRAFT_400455 [Marasmius fiardii PR-910]